MKELSNSKEAAKEVQCMALSEFKEETLAKERAMILKDL